MSTADAVAGVLWVGVTLYAVFGGADFGAGFWSLVAARGERGERVRALIDWAIGAVWEANHVWLIFVLVILWTAFSVAFASIMSTLFIPLSLAAFGIVLRGSGFAFHRLARRARGRRVAEELFNVSSLLTPFFMGTVVGAVAGQGPGRQRRRGPDHELVQPSLAADRRVVRRDLHLPCRGVPGQRRPSSRRPDLERYFSTRALVAGLAAGVIAFAGILVLRADARYVYDGLTSDALPLVIISGACGLAVLALLYRGYRRWVRPLAVGAVVAIVWGWGVAQFPYLLPETLTIKDGAGASETLDAVLIVFGVAVVLVLPAFGLLVRAQPAQHARARGAGAWAGRAPGVDAESSGDAIDRGPRYRRRP